MAVRVKVKNISKQMGHTQALDNINADFEAGLVHGIIGPNGAGKTTLMRLLATLLTPNSGTIKYFQNGKLQPAKEQKAHIGYFPQEPSLYPDLSCKEHLEFFRDLYGLSQKDFLVRSKELLQATGMTPFTDRPAGKLSGGMYKKLGLMCILLNRPQLLLLDEPTIGVDPVSRQELWEIVYGFAGENMTVILTTSYMDEAQRCGRVYILEEGHMPACGAPRDLMKQFKVKDFAEIFLHDQK